MMRVGQVDEKSSSSTLRDPAAQNRGFVCALLAGLDNAAGHAGAGPGPGVLAVAVRFGVHDDRGAVVVKHGVVDAPAQGDGVAEVVGASGADGAGVDVRQIASVRAEVTS